MLNKGKILYIFKKEVIIEETLVSSILNLYNAKFLYVKNLK